MLDRVEERLSGLLVYIRKTEALLPEDAGFMRVGEYLSGDMWSSLTKISELTKNVK